MARDNVNPVRLDDDLDAFMAYKAAGDRRPKLQFMALVIEDYAIEHGYLDWKQKQAEERLNRYRKA